MASSDSTQGLGNRPVLRPHAASLDGGGAPPSSERRPAASTYICEPNACSAIEHGPWAIHHMMNVGVCWHESTERRLIWQYGEARANAIMAGADDRTQRDIAAWEGLGR